MTREEAFESIIKWIRDERAYQSTKWKYGDEPVGRATDEQWWWLNGITNYWSRVRLFTVMSLNGRQAAAKIITTMVHMLELAITKYGPLPKPGVSSGDIQEWT